MAAKLHLLFINHLEGLKEYGTHSDTPEPLISLTRKALGKEETSFRDLCRAPALNGLKRDS